MRKFFAAAVASAVSLVGFAGLASASATVDLLWGSDGGPKSSGLTSIDLANEADSAVMQVILTAGPNGSIGAGVSVDYTSVLNVLVPGPFKSTPSGPLPIGLGTTTDDGMGHITNIGAGGFPPGLAPGATFQLGTVTFTRTGATASGLKEILVTSGTGSDNILDGSGNVITDTSTLNSAFVNVPEPGAISLLVMGLGGMLVAGRSRRS